MQHFAGPSNRLGRGNLNGGLAGDGDATDEVERGGSGGGRGLAGIVKYRKCRRSRSISVRSFCTLEDGMIALGGVAVVAALAGPARHRWCLVYARIRSTRLCSAVGVECFGHGSTLAYRGGVGQAALRGILPYCPDLTVDRSSVGHLLDLVPA